MKRLLVTVALALFAVPSFAALQYEFMQKNTTDNAAAPSTDLTARAIIDGDRTRVEFINGTVYPPGTYVVSTDASRRLFFVDPSKQWYTEVNTSGIATSLGASNIKIENLKSEVTSLPDKLTIAGIPADHYHTEISYDITVVMKTIPLKQHVQTEIDSWMTTRFGIVHTGYIPGGNRTGNADLDRVLEAETPKAGGFPMRQIVTVRTHYDVAARSKLKVPTSHTIIRETWVTNIKETASQPSMFVVPATYRRADQPEVPKATTQVLTFEPATK